MKIYLSLAVLVTGAVFSVSALAQGDRQGRGRGGSLPLETGDPLPNASGVTEDGKPFLLQELKGDYTVLVFGCLT